MANRKNRRKPRRKVMARKRFPRQVMRLPPLGNPNKMLRRFRYTEQAALDPGAVAGVPNVNVYALNGLYDPQISIGGSGGRNGQPRGFDQYFAGEDSIGWYKRYRVIGAKVTVKYWTIDSTHTQRIGLCIKDHSTGVGDSIDYVEDKRNVDKIAMQASGGQPMGTLTKYWSAKKYWGKKSADDDDASGTYNSNPAELAYIHLWADTYTADSAGFRYELVIDFITICFDPVLPYDS